MIVIEALLPFIIGISIIISLFVLMKMFIWAYSGMWESVSKNDES